MFVVFVDMQVKPESRAALESTFSGPFRTAISKQPGFATVALLRQNKDGGEYRLTIVFESQKLQQIWVATDLHQEVWPHMEAHLDHYAVSDYTTV